MLIYCCCVPLVSLDRYNSTRSVQSTKSSPENNPYCSAPKLMQPKINDQLSLSIKVERDRRIGLALKSIVNHPKDARRKIFRPLLINERKLHARKRLFRDGSPY